MGCCHRPYLLVVAISGLHGSRWRGESNDQNRPVSESPYCAFACAACRRRFRVGVCWLRDLRSRAGHEPEGVYVNNKPHEG